MFRPDFTIPGRAVFHLYPGFLVPGERGFALDPCGFRTGYRCSMRFPFAEIILQVGFFFIYRIGKGKKPARHFFKR